MSLQSIFFNNIRKNQLNVLNKFGQFGPEELLLINNDVYQYNISYNNQSYSDYTSRGIGFPDPPEPIAHLNITINTNLDIVIFRVNNNIYNGVTNYFILKYSDLNESNGQFCIGNVMLLPDADNQYVTPQSIRIQATQTTSNNQYDYGIAYPQLFVPTDPNGAITLGIGEYTIFNALTGQFDSITNNVCCIAGNSKVKTNIGYISIENIKTSDNIILYDYNNNPVKLIYNIKFLPTSNFILIKKDALGENMPDDDLYIIDGHPIDVDGVETLPRTLINDQTILRLTCNSKPVYTLCADKRIGVMINNIPVYTWNIDEWLDCAKTNGVPWFII